MNQLPYYLVFAAAVKKVHLPLQVVPIPDLPHLATLVPIVAI